MGQNPPSQTDCLRSMLAGYMIKDKKLAPELRKIAINYLAARHCHVESNKGGRPSGAKDESIAIALLFDEIRPEYRTKEECIGKSANAWRRRGKA